MLHPIRYLDLRCPDCRWRETCGKAIEPERVQAVPGTRFCAACQRKKESGRPVEEKDYCPRCGLPLEVRMIGEGPRTRYVLGCSAKPPCRL